MRNLIIITLSFILLSVNIAAAQTTANASAQKKLIIKTTKNKVFDLSQQKGKVVILAFWASWCTICKVEMNQLNELYEKYHKQGLEILGLNIDGKMGWGTTLEYPIAFVDSFTITDLALPRVIPFIYVINKDSSLANQLGKPAEVKIENVENIVKNLLNPEKPVVVAPVVPKQETEQAPSVAPVQNNSAPKNIVIKKKFSLKKAE